MIEVLKRLELAGCRVAGIPCNTAHAPAILSTVEAALRRDGFDIAVLHIVDAIVSHIAETAPNARQIGVLATTASIDNRLHQLGVEAAGLRALRPDEDTQRLVHASIYDPEWGLKAQSNPPSREARTILLDAADRLIEAGADAVILGCTELPLAVPDADRNGRPFINSTRALARALIRASHPEKLRPMAAAHSRHALGHAE
jgi:aspartate racemase